MLKRFLKILIGICLLPACFGISRSFYELLRSLGRPEQTMMFFLIGIGIYSLMFFSGIRLSYLYVLGHETTHALIAILCGAKIKSFNVSSQGGSVATTKNNSLISLGPYFLPILTIFFITVFWGAGFFVKDIDRFAHILILLIGWSIGFHFLMTIRSMQIEQPDIIENGYLFSFTLIYLINITLLALLLGLIFKQVELKAFLGNTAVYTKQAVIFLYDKFMLLKK